jgi:DNA-binding NarL/FixJ family response regulator
VTVIAVVTDLIFSTKITGTAKALGGQVLVARSVEALTQRLDAAVGGSGQGTVASNGPDAEVAGGEGEAGAGRPLVIVDLNSSGVDGVAAVRAAKGHASGPRVVAFLSHLQAELAAAARAAGADQVMARSAFVERLPELVGGAGGGGAA